MIALDVLSIAKRLGLDDENLIDLENICCLSYPRRWMEILQKQICPDLIYNFNNKPIILFKVFNGNYQHEVSTFMRKVQNFNETLLVIILLPDEIQVYNGYVFERSNTGLIKGNIQSIDDEIFNCIKKTDIITGRVFTSPATKKYFEKNKRVDVQLLNNLISARSMLIKNGMNENLANSLLCRCIFIQYLIDRGALGTLQTRNDFIKIIENKHKLYELFTYLRKKFNGDMFNINKHESDQVNSYHLSVLYKLFSSDNLGTGQQSLFDLYDFSIIPVELISNIYERFLSLQEKKDSKAIYTPLFLVDFILAQTLDDITDSINPLEIRILDPSCGSGVFLVESFRKVYSAWLKSNPNSNDQERQATLKYILQNNIFGIDINNSSIDIAIFSLYVATLDYLEPRDIEKNGFIFPVMLGRTLFVADIFDLNHMFNEVLIKIKFNFVIGNPPWGTPKQQDLFDLYCNERLIPMSDRQIAQAFLFRVADFSNMETEIVQIVTSKIIYNVNAKSLRDKFLNTFAVLGYLDLSISGNMHIFKDALGSSCVLFYKKSDHATIEQNMIQHLVLRPNYFLQYFSMLTIEKGDMKLISQAIFIENDWAWKVFLYGNTLDYVFLTRLMSEKNYREFNDYLDDQNIANGPGFIESGGGPYDLSTVANIKTLPMSKKDKNLRSFYVNKSNLKPFNEVYKCDSLHREGTPSTYTAPHLIIKRSVQKKLILAYSEVDFSFPNTVFGFKSLKDNRNELKAIGAILSSELIAYILFLMSSQWGIERPEVYIKHLRLLPFPVVLEIETQNLLSDMFDMALIAVDNQPNLFSESLENYPRIEAVEARMSRKVNEIYCLSPTEIDLVDYLVKYTIANYRKRTRSTSEILVNDADLHTYCDVFFNTFNNLLKHRNMALKAEIYYGDYYIGLNFVFACINCENNYLIIDDNNEFVSKLGNLGLSQLSNEIFIQRDIKGFTESSFYIVKTKENRRWHPTMARLDVVEIMEALRQSNQWRGKS